jgi:hypothetical protein
MTDAISLQLNADNSFVMSKNEGNRRVEGQYAFRDGLITFSEATGDTGPVKFPLTWRFETVGDEFRLNEHIGSCARFKGLTFRPAAG